MLSAKRIISAALCAALIGTVFAGCSSTKNNQVSENEINDTTLLIAYYDENQPFFYKSDDGKSFTGLEADIISKSFDVIKDSCKTYSYIKVDKNYRLGEDTAYTDKDGNTYIAYMAVGGNRANYSTNNEDFSMTNPIVSNRIIALTAKSSKVTDYSTFNQAKVGVTSESAKTSFDRATSITSVCQSIGSYDDINTALADLDSGKIDVVITDEFSYKPLKTDDKYTELKGEIDTIDYCIMTAKGDRLKDDLNEAVYELKSTKYNDKDEFTPMVEKYFSYNASAFDYTPQEG